MRHKLKIEMEFEEGQNITDENVLISLDNENIGLVQKLSIIADIKNTLPQIEIVFPEMCREMPVSKSEYRYGAGNCIDILNTSPNIHVNYR